MFIAVIVDSAGVFTQRMFPKMNLFFFWKNMSDESFLFMSLQENI